MEDIKFLYHNSRGNDFIEERGFNEKRNKLLLYSDCETCLKHASKIDNEIAVKINCENIAMHKDENNYYYTYDEILPSYIEVIKRLPAFEMNNNINFEQFVEMLKKGYIKTTAAKSCESEIIYRCHIYKIEHIVEIVDKYNINLTIFCLSEIPFWCLDYLLSFFCQFYGFYPIELSTEYNSVERNFSWNEINSTNIPEDTDSIKIKLSSEYDDNYGTNTMTYPEILYHISDVNENDILKNGLSPNAKYKPTPHPEKIMLYTNYEYCKNIRNNNEKIYEINIPNNEMVLHYNKINNVFYSTNKIKNKRIKLINI
jgi:hypothetical protein